MKKTFIALGSACALLTSAAVSANCSFHQYHSKSDPHHASMSGQPKAGMMLVGSQHPANAARADIVDTAISAGSFNTLVKAVQAAGLVETLKSEGPFTVFAPTDAAFAKLPAGTLEALLADPARLAAVLKYHVVPGKLDARAVTGMSRLATAQGSQLPVGNIRIASTDIETTNGIIHVIDEVLIPQS